MKVSVRELREVSRRNPQPRWVVLLDSEIFYFALLVSGLFLFFSSLR